MALRVRFLSLPLWNVSFYDTKEIEMTKKLKGYGKNRKVCYKHRSIIGGARCSSDFCENCKCKVDAAVASPPRLCGKCSVLLSQCAFCRAEIE